MSSLVVIDASCYIKYGSKASFSENANVFGFPTGGIAALMNALVKFYKVRSHIIICFDSKTDRKELYPGYKGNRPPDPKSDIQIKTILPGLIKAGFQVEKKDGFEADDLIHHVVKQNKGKYTNIIIQTNDADQAANIDEQGFVHIKSPTALSPDINRKNYDYTVNRKDIVMYNSITPYKVFYGDNSDNIGVFQSVSKEIDKGKLYNHFMQFAMNSGEPPETFSSKILFLRWLKETAPQLPDADKKELWGRFQVLYPKDFTGDLTFKGNSIDPSVLQKVLSTFKLGNALKHLKMDMLPMDEQMKTSLFKLAQEYKQGVSAVDNNAPVKSESFSKIDMGYETIKGF